MGPSPDDDRVPVEIHAGRQAQIGSRGLQDLIPPRLQWRQQFLQMSRINPKLCDGKQKTALGMELGLLSNAKGVLVVQVP